MARTSTLMLDALVERLEKYRHEAAGRPTYGDVILYENILAAVKDEESGWYGCDPVKVMDLIIDHGDALWLSMSLFEVLDTKAGTVLDTYEDGATQCR